MKRKLPSYAMQNFKNASKRNGIYAFLIIFLMTVSTFGQTFTIDVNCNPIGFSDLAFEFETQITTEVNTGIALDGGVKIEGFNMTLQKVVDRWEISLEGDPVRWLYTTDGNFVSEPCSATWKIDSLGEIRLCVNPNDPEDAAYIPKVTCPEICDGIDNDGDGEIDEGLEGCTPPAIIQYCNEAETKVLICHNGNEICVSINAVDAHIPAHEGDTYGPCASPIVDNQEEATDIEDITKGDPTTIGVKYWPNPSNDVFNVKMITLNFEDKISLQVFDINGRLVHANVIGANKNYQFGNNLSNGIYFAKLTQAGTSKVLKVVKH